jgi:hypothetical protein
MFYSYSRQQKMGHWLATIARMRGGHLGTSPAGDHLRLVLGFGRT